MTTQNHCAIQESFQIGHLAIFHVFELSSFFPPVRYLYLFLCKDCADDGVLATSIIIAMFVNLKTNWLVHSNSSFPLRGECPAIILYLPTGI
jgi:hypothetical protein